MALRSSVYSLLFLTLAGCASNGDGDQAGWLRVEGASSPGIDYSSPEPHQQRAFMALQPGHYTLTLGDAQGQAQAVRLYRKIDLPHSGAGRYDLTIDKAGRYQVIYNEAENGESGNLRIVKAPPPVKAQAASAPTHNNGVCTADYSPQQVTVGPVFKDGEQVRDAYSGQLATVENGQVKLTPAPHSDGLMLIESAQPQVHRFTWKDATIYFVITDRFANGRSDNDHSYGRKADGKQEIGTFHGGDFAGLTQKLDYIQKLGVTALWISPPFEQIHGWVGGGDRGDFKHYAYHGYYILDYTRLDKNMGTGQELRTLIDEAHKRHIRVLFDIVMNHPGYNTLQDMQEMHFGDLKPGFEKYLPQHWGDWEPKSYENYHSYHALIDYDGKDWANWWGKDWVRAGIYNYDTPPNVTVDPYKGSVAFLPDFKTESNKPVRLPTFLRNKPDTRAHDLPNATVRDYLVTWLSNWVRDYGIDGFRVDTAKHVEPAAWSALKKASQQAWQDYYQAHPQEKPLEDSFWMVGEVFPHGVSRDHYFNDGFDAVINFDFQKQHAEDGAKCLSNLEPVFDKYAKAMNSGQDFNVLTYISSHDTQLFSTIAHEQPRLEKNAGAALLLLPGAVQIYYGDESGRQFGATGSDPTQGTRSDMNWAAIDAGQKDDMLQFWRTLGQFRRQHPAIGAGRHQKLDGSPYTFARTDGHDRVVIAVAEQR